MKLLILILIFPLFCFGQEPQIEPISEFETKPIIQKQVSSDFRKNNEKEKKFEIFLYLNSSGNNYNIPLDNTKRLIFFTLQKKIPFENFEYSLQEIFLNKITKVKRQNWEKSGTVVLSFAYNYKIHKIKILNEKKLEDLNIIYSDNVKKIKFNSINKILKKADKIYVIVENWNNDNSYIKAYEVKMLEPPSDI